MKSSFFSVCILALALVVSSCSTVFNGSKQSVAIHATPDRAKIYVDGDLAGTGSATALLSRGKDHVVEVKLDGYRTAKIQTDKSLTGWFWGNLICGGILGFAIDLITGAAFDVDPNNINVTLEQGTGMLNIPAGENLGHINVQSTSGDNLASIDLHWQ